MKKKLLFIALFTLSLVRAQSIEFTSAALTTAEIGSTITVDFKYTIASDGYIYCAIELLDDWTWSANVVNAELTTAVAGTDVTGSFDLTIPTGILPTTDLTGNLNYKLKIELKQNPSDWLAGAYPNTQIDLTAPTASVNDVDNFLSDLTVFPNPVKNVIQIRGTERLDISAIKILNVLGKEVMKSNFNNDRIDVSNLNSGIYILTIQSDSRLKSIKFIKQ